MKNVLIIIIILLIINNVSSLKIGLTPSELFFKGQSKELLCKNMTFYSDKNITLALNVKWSENYSREIKSYNILSNQQGINEEFPKILDFVNRKEVNVCFKFLKKGTYYGILFAQTSNNNIGVGSYIKAELKDEKANSIKIALTLISSSLVSFFGLIFILIYERTIFQRNF